MRDEVISVITKAALEDRDIIFLSADFGAPALDEFRRKMPNQFINTGICEQHMIDMAAGLALDGKRVICYAMAPFITGRCYEQIKCSLGGMNLPVTLIGVGAGLGYDTASMTHIALDDIPLMRAINNMEVYSPSDTPSAAMMMEYFLQNPKLRYLRLDRQPLEPYYQIMSSPTFQFVLSSGLYVQRGSSTDRIAIIGTGATIPIATAVAKEFNSRELTLPCVRVVDLFRLKPINLECLSDALVGIHVVITIEEQMACGGMGSAVLEKLNNRRWLQHPQQGPLVSRIAVEDGFQLVNGNREHLQASFGIGQERLRAVVVEALEMIKNA